MKDQLLKALVLNEHVRLYIVRTTDLVQEAQDRLIYIHVLVQL